MVNKNYQTKRRQILEKKEIVTSEDMPFQVSETTVDYNSIQQLAYQIYREKGGAALDNWLEAESNLRHDIDSFDSS